jgi:hypothetical protein
MHLLIFATIFFVLIGLSFIFRKYINTCIDKIDKKIEDRKCERIQQVMIEHARGYRYYELIDDYTKDWALYVIAKEKFDPEEVEHFPEYADNNCIKYAWIHFWGGFTGLETNKKLDMILEELEK